jgi:phage terminase large subunit-like protein
MAIHTKGTFAYNPSLGSLLMNHSAKSKKLDSYKNSLTLLDEYHAYDDDNALV